MIQRCFAARAFSLPSAGRRTGGIGVRSWMPSHADADAAVHVASNPGHEWVDPADAVYHGERWADTLPRGSPEAPGFTATAFQDDAWGLVLERLATTWSARSASGGGRPSRPTEASSTPIPPRSRYLGMTRGGPATEQCCPLLMAAARRIGQVGLSADPLFEVSTNCT